MASPGNLRCPYCLREHPLEARECETLGVAIPRSYATELRRGAKTTNMLTIGYSGHGKTCYLASLIYSLYHGEPIKRWDGFSYLGLNDATLDMVQEQYVSKLALGKLPDATREFAPYTLILQLNDIPLATRVGPMTLKYAPRELILNMYDAMGEVFEQQQTISDNIQILAEIENLVLLFDLARVRRDALTSGKGPEQQLHNLLSRVLSAISELDQVGRKGIVVCFTKSDEFWNKPDYGPLAVKPTMPLAGAPMMGEYIRELDRRSKEIGDWVRAEYPSVYNALVRYFSPVRFTCVSALGTAPGDDRTVAGMRPSGIVDPLLSLLRIEGLL